MKIILSNMVTESRNEASSEIDTLPVQEVLSIINNEDKKVALAVEQTLPDITLAVEKIIEAFANGGRLVYIGAGTSGRLGILDASECPPTYGVPDDMVIGIIAGGHKAILAAQEGAEDDVNQASVDLKAINFSKSDVLVGIAASGRTPYVIGGLEYAKTVGATCVAISCNPNGKMKGDINITPVVGPEVVTGSSRMKAGTAQKLILNMLTTASMIKSGKVFGNLMVDVQATNEKLVARQQSIVSEATGCTNEEAIKALSETNNHCKSAIFMILSGLEAKKAIEVLNQHRGFIRDALNSLN